jgi:gluconate 2-dehydrogenase gamma chain
MSEMHRREIVQLLAAAPLAAVLEWSTDDVVRANRAAARERRTRGGAQFTPQFFTPHEYDTVRVLVDMIIPRDERSGSATDASVPEFMDFIVMDETRRQTAMRGGLAWLDAQCRKRFEATFLDCADDQRRAVLDDIAWPGRAPPELSHGVAFFNSFRDLTASGFWSSRMGVEDLQYRGNVAIPEWTGCPPEVLNKVGVSYDVSREP